MTLGIHRRDFLGVAGAFTALKFLETQAPMFDAQAYAADRIRNNDKFQISEIITDASRIDRNKFNAYYRIPTLAGGWFYLAQNKDVRTNDIFECVYSGREKRQGLLFPKSRDRSKPVAVVSGEKGDIKGDIEIYDTKDGYEARFSASPLITVPSHSTVDSRFLFDVHNTIMDLPEDLMNKFVDRGVQVYLAKNVVDSYYHLYPKWKAYDEKHPNDPKKPWLEVKEDGSCIDHRNYSNTSALHYQKMIIIPETYYEYGTRELETRVGSPIWTRKTVGHELGHALAGFNANWYHSARNAANFAHAMIGTETAYDETAEFKAMFEVDVSRMAPEIKKELSYSWCKKQTMGGYVEAFANIFAALMGTMTKTRAEVLLRGFPNSAEHIRKSVLPEFGVELSRGDIRKNVFDKYLEDTSALISAIERKRFAQELVAILTDRESYDYVRAEGHVQCCR